MPLPEADGQIDLIRLVRGDARSGADAHRDRSALRLRPQHSLGPAAFRRSERDLRPSCDPAQLAGAFARNARYDHDRRFRDRCGRDRAVHDELVSFTSGLPAIAIRSTRYCNRPRHWWHDWSAIARSSGHWRDAIIRSLITLKMLTYCPTGGIVAAPTTSLPEWIGGIRNWDYRFCWLRDATLTLYALMTAGYRNEARAWREWLLRSAAGHPSELQIMYGIAGERPVDRVGIPLASRLRGQPPVRIGNAAYQQLQIDVYGELMDTLLRAIASGSKQMPLPGICRTSCSTFSSMSGTSPIGHLGKPRRATAISLSPRSWHGSRSIAPSNRSISTSSRVRARAGSGIARARSPRRSSPRAMTPNATPLCSITAAATSTPLCC